MVLSAPIAVVNTEAIEFSSMVKELVQHPSDCIALEVQHKHRSVNNRLEVEEGVFIEYDVYGPDNAKEKIVWVMGFLASRSLWFSFINGLLRSDPIFEDNFQMLLVDNRGMGGSSAPAGRYRTDQMAEDALKIIDHLKWEEFHLVGLSMGGMISQELALKAKDSVRSLALLVTHAGGPRALPAPRQLGGYMSMAKTVLFSRTPQEFVEGFVSSLYTQEYLEAIAPDGSGRTNKQKSVDTALARTAIARQAGKELQLAGVLGQLSATQTHRVPKARLQGLLAYKYPILLVGAKKDRLIHHRNAAAMYKALDSPQTKHIEVEGGHGVLLEDQEVVLPHVIDNIMRGIHGPSHPI